MNIQSVIISESKSKKSLVSKALIASVIAVVLALGLVLPAKAATSSTKTTFDRNFSFACSDFIDVEHYVGTETTKYFSDGSQKTTEHVESTFTNSVTGKQLSSTTNFVLTFDGKGGLTVTGATFRLNTKGNVSLDTGRRVYNANGEIVFDAGQNDAQPNLCQVLAN